MGGRSESAQDYFFNVGLYDSSNRINIGRTLSLRFHSHIPESEVKAKIVFRVFVMMVMVACPDDIFTKGTVFFINRINFHSRMI